MTPILANGLFVALGETVHFPPWDGFFNFELTVNLAEYGKNAGSLIPQNIAK